MTSNTIRIQEWRMPRITDSDHRMIGIVRGAAKAGKERKVREAGK